MSEDGEKPDNVRKISNYRGRQPGTRNKITRIMKDALLIAACEVGDVDMYVDTSQVTTEEQRGQLVGYLKWVAINEPKTFCAMLGRLLPMQMTASLDVSTTKTYATKQELADEMRRRGLPIARMFLEQLPEQAAANNDD
jgi:hypothetical protein